MIISFEEKWEQHRRVVLREQASQPPDVSVGQEVQPSEKVRVVTELRAPMSELLHRCATAASHAEAPMPLKL